MVMEELIRELRDIVREAFRLKQSEREIGASLFENVFIGSDDEWREVFHEDVPNALRELLEKVGLTCSIFHKKDDVPGYEYLANCVSRTGRKVALGFDVDYDYEIGDVYLAFASAWRDSEWSENQLVHYHEV